MHSINLKRYNLLPFIWFIICITEPQPKKASNRSTNPRHWDEVRWGNSSRLALLGLFSCPVLLMGPTEDNRSPDPPATDSHSFQFAHLFSLCVPLDILLVWIDGVCLKSSHLITGFILGRTQTSDWARWLEKRWWALAWQSWWKAGKNKPGNSLFRWQKRYNNDNLVFFS